MRDRLSLGIELGSTRIKAVLIDESARILAQGSYEWENVLSKEGLWTYSLDDVANGVRAAYASLATTYAAKYQSALQRIDSVGISAMMHGYLVFDADGKQPVPFRTWRNTNAEKAAEILSERFRFHIPARWSVAHLYQAILDGEAHVKEIAFMTTLAGYVHERLCGQRVLGIGDASGMFPITDHDYDERMLCSFNELLRENGLPYSLREILPKVLVAGEGAGTLTEEGALWLDPTGTLLSGSLMCPPEGDAGTGMVATNSVSPNTANVSAGTSGFLMAVLERPMTNWYPEIDVVATPNGAPVAMVHVNNFASEITAWTNLFEEVISLGGGTISRNELFHALYQKSLEAETDCGGLLGYNFLSGEPIAQISRGVPMMMRLPEGRLTLANFMKLQIYSALGSLAMGMEVLRNENIRLTKVCGHGGFFKTPFVGQSAMSAALGAPITVMENAGEGGAWGIALLAFFAIDQTECLEDFLVSVFAGKGSSTISASEAEQNSFAAFMSRYQDGLKIEKCASEVLV